MVFSGLRNTGKLAVAEEEYPMCENSFCVVIVIFRSSDVET